MNAWFCICVVMWLIMHSFPYKHLLLVTTFLLTILGFLVWICVVKQKAYITHHEFHNMVLKSYMATHHDIRYYYFKLLVELEVLLLCTMDFILHDSSIFFNIQVWRVQQTKTFWGRWRSARSSWNCLWGWIVEYMCWRNWSFLAAYL